MRKKRTLVQKGRKGLSIRKQCKLLGISGNAVYYKPKGERPENEEAMKKMDRFYMEHPTAGARTMRQHLLDEGLHLNLKRVRRLMRKMGIDAIYPIRSLSKAGKASYIKPYLLPFNPLKIHQLQTASSSADSSTSLKLSLPSIFIISLTVLSDIFLYVCSINQS